MSLVRDGGPRNGAAGARAAAPAPRTASFSLPGSVFPQRCLRERRRGRVAAFLVTLWLLQRETCGTHVHSFDQSRSQSAVHSNQRGLRNPRQSGRTPGGRDQGVNEAEGVAVCLRRSRSHARSQLNSSNDEPRPRCPWVSTPSTPGRTSRSVSTAEDESLW